MLKVTNRLYELRKRHELKQESLALELGITRKTLHNIETNKTTMSKKVLDKVCTYFKIAPKDVLNLDTESGLKNALKLEDLEPILLEMVLEFQFLKSSTELGLETLISKVDENNLLAKEIKKKVSELDTRLKRRKKNTNTDKNTNTN